jgi:hypothetical protein
MRLVFTALVAFCALALTGCAGWKVGMGYNHTSQQFFLQLERPLEPKPADPALKK